MNLVWAREFMSCFNQGGLEKVMGMYTDDVQFEEVTFGFKANGKGELREFFKGGKISSQHDYWDASSVLKQLGAIK